MTSPRVIYSPESPLRRPGVLARNMVFDVFNSRELAWRLFVRDISAQYRQSIFGYIWVFIPPLVTSIPFIYLNRQGVVSIGNTPIPYAAYAIIGTTIWQVFVDALNAPLRAVMVSRQVLARINLPREAILMSAIAQVLLGFLARLLILVVVLAWFHMVPPTTVLLFPLGIFSLILVGFVAGVLITPLGILYTDVQQILPIVTTFLMLLTPVVYPMPQGGFAASVAAFNPLTPLVTATRDWLTVGATPHSLAFFIITSIACACLFIVWTGMRVVMPHIIARLGS